MSVPTTDRSVFVPPPIDGLNLVAHPTAFLPTEARKLDNYRVFDHGIRQVGAPTRNHQNSEGPGMMFKYLQSGTSTQRMLYTEGTKLYRLDAPTDAAGTDVTAALVITNSLFFPCYHNKRIFLFNGIDAPIVHDLGTGNATATGLTGPTIANLVQGCSYNHRLYAVDQYTTSFWYGGVDAITGAMTEFDVGQVLNQPGFLSFVLSWTTNQGQSNQDFFVAVSSSGEVLVYSGDYPTHPNWFLIARGQIPELYFPEMNQPYCRLGTDIIISTTQGLVKLSSVFAGINPTDPLYTVSRKIKDKCKSSKSAIVDKNNPFLYAANNVGSGIGDIYCQNYERGAWSRIPHGALTTNSTIAALEIFGDYLMVSTGGTDHSLWRYPVALGTASSSLNYRWATPGFDFGGKNLQKQSNMVRVLGRNVANSSTFKNTVSVSTDFVDPASPITDVKTTSVAADTEVIQELAPPGVGRRLSYDFNRAGVSAINELNEILGFEAHYSEGGIY